MEAHNGASAILSERAGFDGLWASGLSMSTALGVRDSNELSWSQVLDQLEFMADAVSLPILVDGDTGFGNFNTVRRFVRKLSMRGIAGVCIEDKTFPKTNSFLGDRHALVPIEEFCGKIRAGKDAQDDPDFCIVARIEALIAGRPMAEALQRAEAYAAAGADAIVIHSRRSEPDEILAFMAQWEAPVPVVLIPTKYWRTPTDRLLAAGASAIVWANHNLRASLTAMETVTRQIAASRSLLEVEPAVYPLDGVFALTSTEELADAERRYEPQAPAGQAIVLAASRGEELGALTRDRPKCMIPVRGQTILERQMAAFARAGWGEVTVVAGYGAEAVTAPTARIVVNADFATTGEAQSLALATDRLTGPALISYGDIVFEPFFAELLAGRDADVTLLVDPTPASQAPAADLVLCDPPPDPAGPGAGPARVLAIGPTVAEGPSDAGIGQWMGLMSVSIAGARKLREALAARAEEGRLAQADMADLLTDLMAAGATVEAVRISGNWRNVNSLLDLAEARDEM
jgi:phosphoenolpyruvate phosphomutase